MDLRELDQRATAATGAIIDQVPEDLLDAPTPCTRWTIRQIVEHLVDNNRSHIAEARGVSEVDDIGRGFAETSRAFTETFADPAVLSRPFVMGGIPSDGRGVVAVHFADVLVHGWDIGCAAGLAVTFEEDLAAAALRITERFPDTPAVRGPNGAFALPVRVPDDAPAPIRLLGFTGRDPAWSPAQRQAS